MSAPTHTLLLNADCRPLKVVSWERAMLLLLEEKADLIVGYANRLVRSVAQTFEWPAVVRLRTYQPPIKMRLNRQNVLARDSYTCAYCGKAPKRKDGKPLLEDLTIDHVIPRAQAEQHQVRLANGKRVAVTSWENLVTACYDCNASKGGRTPSQAKMPLRFQPRQPSPSETLRMHLRRVQIPEEWREALGDSPWADYWSADLDPA